MFSRGRLKPFCLRIVKISWRKLWLLIIRLWFGQRPIRFFGELLVLFESMWWMSTMGVKPQMTHCFVVFRN